MHDGLLLLITLDSVCGKSARHAAQLLPGCLFRRMRVEGNAGLVQQDDQTRYHTLEFLKMLAGDNHKLAIFDT
eukprot:scaffold275519_cov30-Tisochrysis_lutea.AAC.3